MTGNLGGNELENWLNVERKKEGSTLTHFTTLKTKTKPKSLGGFSLDPLGHHVLEKGKVMEVFKSGSSPSSPQGSSP